MQSNNIRRLFNLINNNFIHEKQNVKSFIRDTAIVYDYRFQRILFVYYPLSNIISHIINVSLTPKLVRSAACKMSKIFGKPRENTFDR